MNLTWPDTVSPELADGVTALAEAAAQADGVEPISEDVRLQLRPGNEVAGRLLVARSPTTLVGLAFLADDSLADDGGGGTAELLVRPDHRRQGIGTALLTELIAKRPQSVWAHGDAPGAAALAQRFGFSRARVLWQLRRPLVGEPLPEPAWPAGVTVRTFEVGRDETAWLALNSRAFAQHPEQGRWDASDLADREAEDWFDPAGFFLAERDSQLVGFHWTKVVPPIGEVYVVGVDPDAAGAGLGKALTLVGLQHLRQAGLTTVTLYVDDDNTAAMRLYASLGFERYACDVAYVRQPTGPTPPRR